MCGIALPPTAALSSSSLLLHKAKHDDDNNDDDGDYDVDADDKYCFLRFETLLSIMFIIPQANTDQGS